MKNHVRIKRDISIRMKNHDRLWLRTDSMDFNIFLGLILDDENEYNIDIEKYVSNKEDLMILDGGANIGLYSYLMMKRFPKARIIAVEPDPDNYRILCMNMSQFSAVECVHGGIWKHKAILQIKETSCGSVGFVVEEVQNDRGTGGIIGYGINDIKNRYEINEFDIIKLDIEGSEYYVFESEDLSWIDGTKIIMMELHDHIVEGASDRVYHVLLEDKGYKSFESRGNVNFTSCMIM